MHTNIRHKGRRRFVPWTAVLSLLTAIVLVAPTVVSAQITGELSQECDFALVGTEHTITVKVTNGGVPVAGTNLMFQVSGVNPGFHTGIKTGEDGTAEFAYTGVNPGVDTIMLIVGISPVVIKTTWTSNEADLCSDAPGVTVGGKVELNAKKKGALKIALCSVDGLDVNDVDLTSVRLVGVKPWRSHQKDSHLCPDGTNGVKDLVLSFNNQKVVEALENTYGELEDGKDYELTLTLSLKDKTSLDGRWVATIKKEGKKHWNKYQPHDNDKKGKGPHK